MTIVYAIAVLGVLAIVFGLILAVAAKVFEVEVDPRLPEIQACLAGANCGGCGYAGCADYAKAIVENGAPTFKCAPGGDKTADAINTIMGNATDDIRKIADVTTDDNNHDGVAAAIEKYVL